MYTLNKKPIKSIPQLSCRNAHSPNFLSSLSDRHYASSQNLLTVESQEDEDQVFPQWLMQRHDFQKALISPTEDLCPADICNKPVSYRDTIENKALKSWTKDCPFFQHLTEHTATEVRKKLKTVTFSKGDLILSQSGPEECLYIIVKGTAKAFKPSGNTETIGPKGTIGDSIVDISSQSYTHILAATAVSALVLKVEEYTDIVRRQKHRERFDMIDYLKKLPFFSDCFGSRLEHIAWNIFPMQYSKGQIIYKVGERPSSLYIVRAGSVKLEGLVALKLRSRLPDGYKTERVIVRERIYTQVFRECRPEDFFGEEEIVSDVCRKTQAVCDCDNTVLWILEREKVLEILTDRDQVRLLEIHSKKPSFRSLKDKVRNDFLMYSSRFKAMLDATEANPRPSGRTTRSKKEMLAKSLAAQHARAINNQLIEEKIRILR